MAVKWQEAQNRIAGEEEIRAWFSQPADWQSIGIVCGKVSGNLEMIDFDFRGEFLGAWKELVDKAGLSETRRKCYLESTQSGGAHVVYRCTTPVDGNMKLAARRIVVGGPGDYANMGGGKAELSATGKTSKAKLEGQEWVAYFCMVETRGEGGQFLVAPSPGYLAKNGSLETVPVLSASERDRLLMCAKALDEEAAHKARIATCDGNGRHVWEQASHESPIAEYNRQTGQAGTIALLVRHGWSECARGTLGTWMTRPGKCEGVSGTVFDDGGFYSFSTNADPFEAGRGYDAFGVLKMLDFGGDWKATLNHIKPAGFSPGHSASFLPQAPVAEEEEGERVEYSPPAWSEVVKALEGSPLATYVHEVASMSRDLDEELALLDGIVLAGLMLTKGDVRTGIAPDDICIRPNVYAMKIGRSGCGKGVTSSELLKLAATFNVERIIGNSEPALIACLGTGNARWGLCYRSEAAKLLGSKDPVARQIVACFLAAFNEGRVEYSTKPKGNLSWMTVEPVAPSLLIEGQPDVFEASPDGALQDTGFLARFLTAFPPRHLRRLVKQKVPNYGAIVAAYNAYAQPPHVVIRPTEFSSRANSYVESGHATDAEIESWKKLGGEYVPKLALMLDPQATASGSVSREHMDRAAVVADWYFGRARKMLGLIHGDLREAKRAKMERFITEHPGCTDRELYRHLKCSIQDFERDFSATILARGGARAERGPDGRRRWYPASNRTNLTETIKSGNFQPASVSNPITVTSSSVTVVASPEVSSTTCATKDVSDKEFKDAWGFT